MRLRNNNALGYTDSLATGLSDASNLANHTTTGFSNIPQLWLQTDPVGAVKNITLDTTMTPAALNSNLMSYGSPRLDVWMQDDTSADYTIVRVFRY
jgi:flagellar basal body rod protein FlgF